MSVTRNDIIGFKVAYEQDTKEYSKEILGLIEKSKLLFENDKASLQSILKLMEDSDLDAIDQLLNELMEDLGIKKENLLKKKYDTLETLQPSEYKIFQNVFDYIKLKKPIKSKKQDLNVVRKNKINELTDIIHKLQIDILFELLTTEDYLFNRMFRKIYFIKKLPIVYALYIMKHLLLNYWIAILVVLIDFYKLEAKISKKALLEMDNIIAQYSKYYTKIKKIVNILFSKNDSKVFIILEALDKLNLDSDNILLETILRFCVDHYHDILDNELSLNQSKEFFTHIKQIYKKINELDKNKSFTIRNLYDEINFRFESHLSEKVNEKNYNKIMAKSWTQSFSFYNYNHSNGVAFRQIPQRQQI